MPCLHFQGRTPLPCAAVQGQVDIMKCLLQNKCDVDAKDCKVY